MAKLGNESRLLLKLAWERQQKAADTRWTRTNGDTYAQGFSAATKEYHQALLNIANELEGGR